MTSDRQAEAVGLFGSGSDRLVGDIFVKLDDLQALLFLFPHRCARIVRSLDHITAFGAQGPCRRRTYEAETGGPNARPADLAEIGAVALGQGPLVVVLGNI